MVALGDNCVFFKNSSCAYVMYNFSYSTAVPMRVEFDVSVFVKAIFFVKTL